MEAACIPVVGQGAPPRAELIVHQIQALGNGYVQLSSPGIDWFIYGSSGQIVYVSNSIDPFERLSRVLRGCLQHTSIDHQTLSTQARMQFEQASSPQHVPAPGADYQVISWLSQTTQLSPEIMAQVIHRLNLEVMESLCLLAETEYPHQAISLPALPALPALDFYRLQTEAQARLQQWQTLQPTLFSPYQRPYLNGASLQQSNLPSELQTRLRQILIGFSWRQIAMLMGQDEIALARQFLPLMQQGIIKLHDPFSPFDQLPWQRQTIAASPPMGPSMGSRTPVRAESGSIAIAPPAYPSPSPSPSLSTPITSAHRPTDTGEASTTTPPLSPTGNAPSEIATKTWDIVCIDDSPAVLNEINRFLQADLFSVTLIEDSKKALMKINSIKPDIILLDANMPGVDGYQVCTMLRKSSRLKHIPVIMVTGNRGLVNRAKAKLAGITDYLNKPFSQKDLLEIIFRHLSE